jgi:hypothetical protein
VKRLAVSEFHGVNDRTPHSYGGEKINSICRVSVLYVIFTQITQMSV